VKDLRIASVTKAFGPQPVLRGVDLTVPAGSFTAILGSSGSGKTTLLRIIAGFERPDEGEIFLGPDLVDDAARRFVPSERRRIGYVPQEGALFPHLTVAENILFGLRVRKVPAAERARRTRVYEEALASIRLEGFDLDEQVKALYRRYIDGELTLAEVGSAIDELDDREFGPVSASRHKRPQEPARSH